MESKFKETKRTSGLSGQLHKYLLVDELPSNFRSYPTDEIYVRGLFFEESENLAKYVGDTAQEQVSYKILKNIYADVIQGVDVGDLELPDFQILMIISSIWTIRGYGWVPNIPCPQTVKNPYIGVLNAKIDELQEQHTEEPIEDFDEQVKKLYAELEVAPEFAKCEGIINRKIELDDLETYDTSKTALPKEITINENKYNIGALTVDDFIALEDYRDNPAYNPTYLSYAMMIKNDMTVQEKYDIIRYNEQSDILQLKEIDDELYIKLKPITKQCPKCHQNCRVYIGLDKLKAYP